jgi:uncharacterized protein CbrC (UPF0167 family)/uncharacterized membrane protein YhdT
MMSKIDYFLDLVINCDDEGIEFARDEVSSEDLGILAAAYWELETWDQKGLLIHLVMDHVDPRTRDVMYDFLQAPDDESGDFVEVTKAIALSHLEKDRERFSVYYEDRELLARMVERTLAEGPPVQATSNGASQVKKDLESALQPEPVITDTQAQAGDVQVQRRRRSVLGWALTLPGCASFSIGSLVLLLLVAAYLSNTPGVTDNPTGFVAALIICSSPLLVVGLILLVVGLFAFRGAKRPETTNHQEQSVGLPKFKYHSDPIATGSVVPSDTVCECCGQNRGFIYAGPVYGARFLRDHLCPWCIADGSAHEKYGAFFTDAAAVGGRRRGWDQVPNKVVEEIAYRTPAFFGWQQGRWWTHCGDAADFLGLAGREEVEAYGPELVEALRADVSVMSDKTWRAYYQDLDKERGPTAYVFRCLHCGRVGGYSDIH